MSDNFSSHILSHLALVHAGSGSMFNLFLSSDSDREGTPYRHFADDYLRWLKRRFVEPPGFGVASEILKSSGMVLLDGTPGIGRFAAAQMLLYELRTGKETFREMPFNEENEKGKRLLDYKSIADGGLLLLDLSDLDDRDCARVYGELRHAQAEVHKHGARLVIVLPDGKAGHLEPGLAPYRVELGRPPGLEVLRRYLRQDGLSWNEVCRPSPTVDRLLGGKPRMEEIARFALLVNGVRIRPGRTGDFTRWCEEAYAALFARDGQVAEDVRELRDPHARALLLATALLHGAHADMIHEAATSLLSEVKPSQEEISPLEGPDFDQRFKAIRAMRDGEGKVHFTELGYDGAVRRHFWTHFPDLRGSLVKWFEVTAISTDMDQGVRDDLIERFTALCLHDRYRAVLSSLVEQWTARPTMNGAGKRAAAQALASGLQDRRQGRYFRRQIYEWATTDKGLPSALAEVIVATCTEVMVVHNPYEAVVRLHHLARRERETTRARDALIRLVRADRRLLRLMLDRFHHQFSEDRGWKGADAGLFLELVDPELLADATADARPLIASDVVRHQVALGWSVVYERGPDDVWEEPARRWLLAAGEAGPRHDVLIDVLVEGGRQRTDVLSRLYGMAGELERVLSPSAGHDMRLRDRVFNKINAALDIQVG